MYGTSPHQALGFFFAFPDSYENDKTCSFISVHVMYIHLYPNKLIKCPQFGPTTKLTNDELLHSYKDGRSIMKTMLLENFDVRLQLPLISSAILIPGYNMANLSMQSCPRTGRKSTSKMTNWYTAIRMAEEVLARPNCSESNSDVYNLSGQALYSSRQL
jgi:hypothetical protein